MKYFIIAGEASGDLHGSNLMRALKAKDADAEFRFLGGDFMKAEAGEPLIHLKQLAFMGFIPVLFHLRTILHNMALTKEAIRLFHPDAVILIDYPSFNLRIARFVKQHFKIPVYYYISPKIWAWKTFRIKEIKHCIDAVLAIFPFEVEFYRQYDYFNVYYVGNPLMDAIPDADAITVDKESFFKNNRFDDRPIVALLAGSRQKEIRDNLPLMLSVIPHYPQYQFVIAGAPGIDKLFYDAFLTTNVEVKIVFNQTYDLLKTAFAAIVTSGTATLETALFHVPQIVVYHLTPARITPLLRKWIIKIPYISLVNIIAQKQVVVELIGAEVTTRRLVDELKQITDNEAFRSNMLSEYNVIQHTLGARGASERAAAKILALLKPSA
ncbi:MAG: lipid-A-disaccharide synthase [Microbacter sp.]